MEQFPGSAPIARQESFGTKLLENGRRILASSAETFARKLKELPSLLPEYFDTAAGLVYGKMSELNPATGKEIASCVRNYAALNVRALTAKRE